AEAGPLLEDALGTAGDAWSENSALAEEAAKRYETSAAQISMAWNQVKDALIDVGAAIVPAVTGVADMVASIARAFQGLPGPAQAAMPGGVEGQADSWPPRAHGLRDGPRLTRAVVCGVAASLTGR